MSGRVDRSHALCETIYEGTEFAWHSLVRDEHLKFVDCSKKVMLNDLVCLWTYADAGAAKLGG